MENTSPQTLLDPQRYQRLRERLQRVEDILDIRLDHLEQLPQRSVHSVELSRITTITKRILDIEIAAAKLAGQPTDQPTPPSPPTQRDTFLGTHIDDLAEQNYIRHIKETAEDPEQALAQIYESPDYTEYTNLRPIDLANDQHLFRDCFHHEADEDDYCDDQEDIDQEDIDHEDDEHEDIEPLDNHLEHEILNEEQNENAPTLQAPQTTESLQVPNELEAPSQTQTHQELEEEQDPTTTIPQHFTPHPSAFIPHPSPFILSSPPFPLATRFPSWPLPLIPP